MISRIFKTLGIVLAIIITIAVMVATFYISAAIIAATTILFIGYITYKTLSARESLK